MGEWISVEDRRPSCGSLVIAFFKNRPEGDLLKVDTVEVANNGRALDASWCGHDDFSHWMPLPEPPKQ